MAWWLWLILGLTLLGGEMANPGGFYLFFFGVAALLVGVLATAQIIVAAPGQWLVFSVLSIVSLLFFRRRMLSAFETPARRDTIDALRGEVAVLGERLEPGTTGRAELRGTTWTVRNLDERTLSAGERCRVEGTDGLTLLVRGETV